MNVYLIPPKSDENDYLANIEKGLESNGVNVLSKKNKNKKFAPIECIFNAILKRKYIVHFNWIENKVTVKGKRKYLNYIVISVWLFLLKIFGTKIVWTMHNKLPHNLNNKAFVNHFLIKFLRKCNLVIIHCSESEKILRDEYGYNGKVLFVPHGNYCVDNEYPDFSEMSDLQFLYFGSISKYKNVPVLIESIKKVSNKFPDIKLNIFGRCKNDDLNNEIKNKVENCTYITYCNKFVSDEELQKLINKCCAVILPYDTESMLNSGSAIYAISKGRCVFIPEFGYIKDICSQEFIYTYNYESQENHIYNLSEKIEEVINESKSNKDYWKTKGECAYKFAYDNLNWNNICKKIADEYSLLYLGKE